MVLEKAISPQTECVVVGSFFKEPNLYITYGNHIRSQYDFATEDMRFFYNTFELMYKTYSQIFDENKVNAFMLQDNDRLKSYKKYGGYNSIHKLKSIAAIEDFDKNYDALKKYSLLREFDRKGIDVEKIMKLRMFPTLSASDIVRLQRSKIDKISTVILSNTDSKVITANATNKLIQFIKTPDIGLLSPWDIINMCFRGLRLGKMLLLGFLSNEGKSRNLMLLMAHLSLISDQKVLLLSNEMTEEEFFKCLLATVINNQHFREQHGVYIDKPEAEIVKGLYRDNDGELMYRLLNDDGDYIETEDEYLERIKENSQEFHDICKVTEWLTNKKDKLFYFLDVGKDYSDKSLEFEIKRHNELYGIKYFAYDTLKCYMEDDWVALKKTTTRLQEMCKELDIFMWANFQLTDDSIFCDVFDLSSVNIATSKQIYHAVDYLVVGKRILSSEYQKYKYERYDDIWGETHLFALDPKKKYFAMKILKNRGDKKIVMLFEYNLDLNTWVDVGELKRIQ